MPISITIAASFTILLILYIYLVSFVMCKVSEYSTLVGFVVFLLGWPLALSGYIYGYYYVVTQCLEDWM